MFNRTAIVLGGSSHHHTTIHQQTHDAADAARLYGQVKAKAIEEIEDASVQKIDGFNVEYVCFHSERTPMDMKNHHKIVAKVNGETIKAEISIEDWDKEGKLAEYRKLAEALTYALFQRMVII